MLTRFVDAATAIECGVLGCLTQSAEFVNYRLLASVIDWQNWPT
jgi:hypothetical protein